MFAAFVIATLGVVVLASMMRPLPAFGAVASCWLSFGFIPAGTTLPASPSGPVIIAINVIWALTLLTYFILWTVNSPEMLRLF